MSKSLGNYVGLIDEPSDMFGKIMSLPDNLIIKYFRLCTNFSEKEISQWEKDLRKKRINPRDFKLKLGSEIVKMYHGEGDAKEAEKYFKTVFQEKKLPSKISEYVFKQKKKILLPELLVKIKLAKSKSEAKRLIQQGGVKINQKTIGNIFQKIDPKRQKEIIFQVGNRKFVKMIFQT